MTGAVENEEWRIGSWVKNEAYLWGSKYPPSLDKNCKSSTKYCYPNLTRQGDSRWKNLHDWISRKMLEKHRYQWGKEFDPTVLTGIGGKNSQGGLDWGDIINKVLNRIEGLAPVARNGRSNSLRWTKEEWAEAFKHQIPLDTPLDKFESGKAMLFVIMCIVTGLIEGRAKEGKIFKRRGRMCSPIDTTLQFRVKDWEAWIKNSDDIRKNRANQCSQQAGYDGCQWAAIALILSVYESMTNICSQCGPYEVSYWISKDDRTGEASDMQYCVFNDQGINCQSLGSKTEAGKMIIIRPGELDKITRSQVFDSGDKQRASFEAQENSQKEMITYTTEQGASSSNGVPQTQDEGPTERLPLHQKSLKDLSSCPSPNPEGRTPCMKIIEKSPLVPKTETPLTPEVEATPQQNLEHAAKDLRREPPEASDPLHRVDEPASEEAAGNPLWTNSTPFVFGSGPPWAIIVGLGAVVCLGIGGGYGLWRTFGRRKRAHACLKRKKVEEEYKLKYGGGFRVRGFGMRNDPY
ncbi:hypothetical protein C922_05577 [Plasmodium inui San Antonio 1]|uniref:Uncharacterized protein n=1 Tax=Plasmodium inui San Antonio 1 TaxID=1237626 RepID=W7AFJ0_9APIC|nr:hypothetical protein C922_05577 [Plasmodium inui San Antonio 1]EUD64041.1 hypothetical protein C922_05577 [Plasmodium inui San Antonio 1]